MKTAILLIVMVLVGALVAFNYGDGRVGPEAVPALAPDAGAGQSGGRPATVPTAHPDLEPASEAQPDLGQGSEAQPRGTASSRVSRGLDSRAGPEGSAPFERGAEAAPEDEATTSASASIGTSDEVAGRTSPARGGTTSDATTPGRTGTASADRAPAASSAGPSAERSAATSSENATRTGPDSERDEAESRRGSRRGRWYRWSEEERYPNLDSWVRPDGPVKVALQAGHWKSAEAPDEQSGLRNNGTRGGGLAEWQVNLAIARKTAALLEERGYEVEVLPTTIPPGYFADVFVSIHADGNNSASVSGYRAAAPRRDRTGRADALADALMRTYGAATELRRYPTITRRMSSYYAFNYRRYEHSLHPMTVGVILETGFLTSPRDRRIIVDAQERAARGIADAVIQFLTP